MDIDKKEFSHKAIIHGQKLGKLFVYFHVQEIPSYNYFIYQCLVGTSGKRWHFEGKLESMASE